MEDLKSSDIEATLHASGEQVPREERIALLRGTFARRLRAMQSRHTQRVAGVREAAVVHSGPPEAQSVGLSRNGRRGTSDSVGPLPRALSRHPSVEPPHVTPSTQPIPADGNAADTPAQEADQSEGVGSSSVFPVLGTSPASSVCSISGLLSACLAVQSFTLILACAPLLNNRSPASTQPVLPPCR